jgi:starch-binding outer membrane protein, SusD/RagB family
MLPYKIKKLKIMKYFKYINITLVTVSLLCTVVLTSCKKDFFEIDDPNGFEVVDSWDDEGAVGLFLNRTYALVIPQWPTLGGIHNTSDELNNSNAAFLYGTLTENGVTDIGTSTSITANRYADIRRCNVAIDGMNASSVMPEATKNSLKGQFFFLRAYTYFKLVRLYGGVPLVLKAQGVEEENLITPRSKTSVCIAAIAKDLDSAAAFLPKTWSAAADVGRITKAAALAVKGKALLYWASPEFNPTNIASRWTDAYAACKAAYDTGIANGFGLLASYANLFTTEDHKEILIVRKYNTSRDLGNNIENITRPVSETTAGSSSNQPTWNLVQAYAGSNGLPITDVNSGYNATQYWLNRDPRFAASIAVNGDLWALSGKSTRRQWQYTGNLDETPATIITGFYCKRLCNTSTSAANAVYNSNTGGGSGMDWIEMRFAEVILNLADCANETGNLTEAKDMVRLIRQRAGIVVGAYDYGLSVATTMAQMRSLILNERQVEFAMEGMRNFDLRRTRNLGLILPRLSYKVAVKAPYAAGTGTTAGITYLDKLNAQGFKPRDTANLNSLSVYTSMFVAPGVTASLEGANTINLPDKYYVYPLPTLFTQTPGIEQTNGWAGGTFNPFE